MSPRQPFVTMVAELRRVPVTMVTRVCQNHSQTPGRA